MTSTNKTGRNEERSRAIREALTWIGEQAEQQKVLLDHDDVPEGVTDIGSIAIPALMLTIGVTAESSTPQQIHDHLVSAYLALRERHTPAEVPHILFAALLNLANLYLRPALDQLEGTDTDLRAAAADVWAAVCEAHADDWSTLDPGER